MRLRGIRLVVLSASLGASGLVLQAQQGGDQKALTCIANAGTPVIVRVEGITELVGDLLLQCSGGTPTPKGAPVPQASVQLFLNTAVTSRNIGLNGANVSEAVLLVDEPSRPNQLVTTPPMTPAPLGLGDGKSIYDGSITGSGPSAVYYPNVFQARQTGSNSVSWEGIPIDPPGTTGFRIFHITNVRANAAQLGLSSTLIPNQIVGFVKITGDSFPGGTITINNPNQVLATIQPGLVGSAFGPDGKSTQQLNVPECLIPGFNPGGPSSNSLKPAGVLNVREGFPGSFRSTNGPPTATSFDAETASFYNPTIRQINNAGDARQAGLANFGSRLRATFNNIPGGVQLFVATQQGPNSSPGLVLQLQDGNTGVPVTALPSGYAAIPVSNGTATAVWEVGSALHSSGQTLSGDLLYTYFNSGCAGTQATCPSGNNIQVNMSFAPISSVSSGPVDPALAIPRFATPTATATSYNGLAGFAINRCFQFTPSFALTGVQPNGQIGPVTNLAFPYITGANIPGGTFSANFGVGTDTGTLGAQDTGITVASPTIQYLGGGTNEPGRAATATSWLTATATSNTTPLTVKLTVDPKGLAPGTYNAQVRLTANGVTVSPFNVPVTLTVQLPRPILKLAGVQHAATYVPGSVAPGEVAVFFGELFGPDNIAVASVNVDTFPTTIGNTQVLFDSVPAPMIYAAKNQVSAMVPFGLAGKASTQVQIVYNGVKSDSVTVPVVSALPGLFSLDGSGGGQGAIFNQDGTLNSFANPAPAGSIVVLYGTGAGQTSPSGRDGKLALSTFPVPLQSVNVFFDGAQGDVLYGAQAPTLIEGVLQVNVRIPATVKPSPGVPMVVKVGTTQSPAWATIAVGSAK